MNVLGINFLSEASVALIRDGKIISAASEERFNREKLWFGFPKMAMDWVLSNANLRIGDIDIIATTGASQGEPNKEEFLKKEILIKNSALNAEQKKCQINALWTRYNHEMEVLKERTPGQINQLKKLGPKVIAIDHHLAHAASAYYTSGWDKSVILTIDGWGENSSNTLSIGENGEIKTINFSNTFDSLGYYYGQFTKFLGFRPHRHEGKILGLAGFGDKTYLTNFMRKLVGFDREKQRFIGKIEEGIYLPTNDNPNISKFLTIKEKTIPEDNIYRREDVAAALQFVLEETVLNYVNNLNFGKFKLCLAGGVFANVKLNQRLLNLPQVENVYIYPNMGDGGLAAGSALYVYAQQAGLKPFKVESVYYGPGYSDEEIKNEIKKSGLEAERHEDMAGVVAELLTKKKIIARFDGKMEWGPRALGNRSILYTPEDKSVNDWLNKQLNRSEFMPFAPVSIKENAKKSYLNYKDDHIAANFMTITYDCSDEMKKNEPAVVHVDGTARPQIVTREINRVYYDIIQKFHKATGMRSIVNTSFNMHEEPIVCSPVDAIRSFQQGNLHYLSIGNYLIKSK